MRFLGFDSEKNHNLVDWCCEEAHEAYKKVGLGIESDGWCLYCVPAMRDRELLNKPRIANNYILYIKKCPFCGAPATLDD